MAMSERDVIVLALRLIGLAARYQGRERGQVSVLMKRRPGASRRWRAISSKSLVWDDLSGRHGKGVEEVPDRTVACFRLVEIRQWRCHTVGRILS